MTRVNPTFESTVFDLLAPPEAEEPCEITTARITATGKISKRRARISKFAHTTSPPPVSAPLPAFFEKPELVPPEMVASIAQLESDILEKLETLHQISKDYLDRSIRESKREAAKVALLYKEKKEEMKRVSSKGPWLDMAQSALVFATGASAMLSGTALLLTGPLGVIAGAGLVISGATTVGCETLKQAGYQSATLDAAQTVSGIVSLVGSGAAAATGVATATLAQKIGTSLLVVARQSTKAIKATYKRQTETLGALSAGIEAKLEVHNEGIRVGSKELEALGETYLYNLTMIVRSINNEIEALRRSNNQDQRG